MKLFINESKTKLRGFHTPDLHRKGHGTLAGFMRLFSTLVFSADFWLEIGAGFDDTLCKKSASNF